MNELCVMGNFPCIFNLYWLAGNLWQKVRYSRRMEGRGSIVQYLATTVVFSYISLILSESRQQCNAYTNNEHSICADWYYVSSLAADC
jgi:hypothetical protein